MLHKCATKDCRRKFKYFGVGQLFIAPRKRKNQQSEPEVEFFWLCDDCARKENEQLLSEHLPLFAGPGLRRTA